MDDPIPFVHNKLLDLLTQAKKFIELHWLNIYDGNTFKLLNDSNGVSWEGTSVLNYMQTALLEILSVIHETSICNLKVLKDSNNIYQVNTSPNLQTVNIIRLNKEKREEKYNLMKNWRWSFEEQVQNQKSNIDDDENTFPKLVVPMLGFFLGGSRYDKKYNDKLYKAHDASSFVSFLLNLDESFNTSYAKNIIDAEFARTVVNHPRNISILEESKNILELKKIIGAKTPEPGNLFVAKFYIGFVIEVNNANTHMKVLGFNRLMPFIEGLVIEEYVLQTNGNWLKTWKNVHGDELLYYMGSTNEKQSSLEHKKC
jgi:hypothetical protein